MAVPLRMAATVPSLQAEKLLKRDVRASLLGWVLLRAPSTSSSKTTKEVSTCEGKSSCCGGAGPRAVTRMLDSRGRRSIAVQLIYRNWRATVGVSDREHK